MLVRLLDAETVCIAMNSISRSESIHPRGRGHIRGKSMFIKDAEAAVVGFHLVGQFFDQMRAAEMAQAANTLEALGVEPGITRLTIFRQAEMASRNESELA